MNNYFLGLDFGTSGARVIIINSDKEIVFSYQILFSDGQLPETWANALHLLLQAIPSEIAQNLSAIALDGTSGTVLLLDRSKKEVLNVLWYSDDRGKEYLPQWHQIPPPHHTVLSATSTLAKVYWWYEQGLITSDCVLLHQADWLGYLLHGVMGVSDYHNALKLGYDVENLTYPSWLKSFPFSHIFPKVLPSGEVVGRVMEEISQRYGINPDCVVKAGTTDSIAAFLASGANNLGDAVTSLGSTLVLKLLSSKKIDHSLYGIYSHRLGDLWLVGGASNTGGAVLKHFFSSSQLEDLSGKINPDIPTHLQYYPLLTKGDRFPVNNPQLEPRISPRPPDDIVFLQGLLEGIANIEARGYELLQKLGATPIKRVYTAGGGAKNETWRRIREKRLNIPVIQSSQTESAYGCALLAWKMT